MEKNYNFVYQLFQEQKFKKRPESENKAEKNLKIMLVNNELSLAITYVRLPLVKLSVCVHSSCDDQMAQIAMCHKNRGTHRGGWGLPVSQG